MKKGNQSSLVYRLLHVICDSLAQGQATELQEMGFTTEQIEQLEQMTLPELFRLSQLSATADFMTIKINESLFDNLMRRLNEEVEDLQLQDELLRAGAPTPMMHHFFGLTSQACAVRRRRLGIVKECGRPRLPDEKQQLAIWRAWQEASNIEEHRRYLIVEKTTGESLNTLWSLINKWKESDYLADHRAAAQEQQRPRMALVG